MSLQLTKKVKNKILLTVILFFAALLISCGSTEPAEEVEIETEAEAPELEETEEIIEDYNFEEDYYSDTTVWQNINSLADLTGTWITPQGTLVFPYELDGNEYLSITYDENDDTQLWLDFAERRMMSIEQVWKDRFIYLPEVYGINYPLSDENGTQSGIHVQLTQYPSLDITVIGSKQQIIIPVEIVRQNLSFFKISEDRTKIKAQGVFRFFSKTFTNMYDSFLPGDPYYSKKSVPKYGLVLSGGGGKGAYEVGVWKAFYEYGLAQKIRALSGTSVGGLNSALFAIQDYDNIEHIWISKVPDKLTQNDALISQEGLEDIISSIPLVKLQQIKFPQVYVTAVRNKFLLAKLVKSKPGQYATRFNLNTETQISQIKKKLLATSAFPIICPSVKLADGFEYSDGGNEAVGGDNTPITPIVDNHKDIDKIFIVYLQHEPKRRIKEIDYDTKELVQIVPSIELGGILDGTANFTSSRIRLLIKSGYEDAVQVLQKNGYYPVSSFWFTDVPLYPSTEDILSLYSEEPETDAPLNLDLLP